MAPSADDNSYKEFDEVISNIADYVYDYNIISEKAWINARTTLLDALGCAYECLTLSEACRKLVGPVYPGTATVPGGFKLPGTRYQLDISKGSFDMGVLIRYLDHNDAFFGAEWGHPSDNLGAILAVSDILNRSGEKTITMHTILEALIKAYEIQGVFQIRNSYNKVGLDHVINVKVASTAVVSWLLDLTREQAKAAISHAWIDGHPLRTYRHAPNAGPRKGWAGGDACMRAVHIALQVKNGQPGLSTALTAPRWGFYDVLFKGNTFEFPLPFSSWCIENILFKVNCAEGHALTAVEAALQVSEELNRRGKTVDDIRKVDIRTQEAAMDIINKQGPLHNPADRDHCMQYMVAVVLVKGAMVDTADYQDDSPYAQSKQLSDLRAKIQLREDPAITREYHDLDIRSATNALTVTLNDGTVLDEIAIEFPLGSPKREETLPLVLEKAKANLGLILSEIGVRRALECWDSKDFGKINVSSVLDLFQPELPN
ncbi:MAG: hypothetical protein LQ351_006557 [Letrouitia transgressa]|nr:MAG: hypothetical protein LQ351_006557 [Letrouitia transgressa]